MTIGAFRAYFQLAKNLINSSIGNVNGDRDIDISDVVALVNIILGSDNSMVKEVVSNLDNLPVSFGGGSGPAR